MDIPSSKPAQRPTLDDVAREAKVSTATVSRCLNEPDRVVEATRQRVLAAVAKLDYAPNFSARALASNRTNTIGAVIPTMDNAMFAYGLQAFQEELARSGMTMLVASSGYDQANEDDQIRVLISRGVDGIFLIGTAHSDGAYAMLNDRGVPYILSWCFRSDDDHLYAGFDNRKAAKHLAHRVLDEGHRTIGMIAGISRGNDRAADRVRGVRDALAERGIAEDRFSLVEAPYALEAGADAFERLSRENPSPTAYICGNDVLAAGALNRARALGLHVPGEVSIVGFDDIDLAVAVTPQLTTVHVPHRRMGQAAARLLIAYIRDQRRPQSEEFATEIIERGSLGPAPR